MKRPSAPLVLSALALFVALGGAAMASTHYLITSTKQISPSVLKELEKTGPIGATGATGATGPAGTPPIVGIVYVTATASGQAIATCPPGYVAIGGAASPSGFSEGGPYPLGVTVNENIGATNFVVTAGIPLQETAEAVCASGPQVQTLHAAIARAAHAR